LIIRLSNWWRRIWVFSWGRPDRPRYTQPERGHLALELQGWVVRHTSLQAPPVGAAYRLRRTSTHVERPNVDPQDSTVTVDPREAATPTVAEL
jgi:hypothetical protein